MRHTAMLVSHVFVHNEERVDYVRHITAEFEERRPRGYSATGCLLEPVYGAAIVAFNDIPPAVESAYSSVPGKDRPASQAALGHAEVNAIAFAAYAGTVTAGATMTLAWFPCINCAAAIVKAGIKRLVATEPDWDYKANQYDFRNALKVLADGGVQVVLVK